MFPTSNDKAWSYRSSLWKQFYFCYTSSALMLTYDHQLNVNLPELFLRTSVGGGGFREDGSPVWNHAFFMVDR